MTPAQEPSWSDWVALTSTEVRKAPSTPGVYEVRQGRTGPTVYVGMAGERSGQGLRGRLMVYTSGKGMVSGLGEAVMDRSLADAGWLRERLRQVEDGDPTRAKQWAADAIAHADLYVRWASTPTTEEARRLEAEVMARSGPDLWNRRR